MSPFREAPQGVAGDAEAPGCLGPSVPQGVGPHIVADGVVEVRVFRRRVPGRLRRWRVLCSQGISSLGDGSTFHCPGEIVRSQRLGRHYILASLVVWDSARSDGLSPRECVGTGGAARFRLRLRQRVGCRAAGLVAPALPGALPPAGGRGRSCGPGCADRVASSLAARRLAPSMTSSANRGCALTFSFCRTLSSRSSWRGAAGPQAARSAVAAGHMVFRASLRAWRTEGYPSEGISFVKS